MSIKITEQAKQKSETIINAVNYMKQHARGAFQNSITPTIERLFDIFVMGAFQNGKSTLINALIGKEMIGTGIIAHTPVIAAIEYGYDTDNVKVVYSDSSEPNTMSFQQFRDKFVFLPEDDIDDYVDRVANISHVELQSRDEIFANGVRLIDSPGIVGEPSKDKAISEFASKANAIIFVLNAVRPFSFYEKEYIAENFAGKNMRNLFFVVNKMDFLDTYKDINTVKAYVSKGLRDVFTDSNGVFDEELYNKRVFFTDAYGASRARMGKQREIFMGRDNVISVPIDLKYTGILELEAALNEFLNSDERLDAIGQVVLKSMADCYRSATANYKNINETKYGNDKVAAYRQRKAIDDYKHHLNDVYCMLYGRHITDEDNVWH